jgi:uncharacterized protein (DUF433 family)
VNDWSKLPEVERDPERVSGAWVFRDTRVPVTALFENLSDGATVDQFLEWFPGITHPQVVAVLDSRNALAWLDTPTLWQVIQRGAETEEGLLLRALHEQQQSEPPQVADGVRNALIAQYDRAVLIRAKAIVLLQQRGEDVSEIIGDR